ncbi:MAG: hypothetical protein V3S24_10450 [Candidatus Tectomicrobia bacterium]
MSLPSKLKQSRAQWKRKASLRGDETRYLRKELRRVKQDRDTYKQRVQQAESQLKARQPQAQQPACRRKPDLVFLALELFLVARIGFRAVARVLAVLGPELGIPKAPCPQTISNWVTRLSLVRLQAVSSLPGASLHQAPFSNGFIWMIDISIGLGAGKILAVLALAAQHHQGPSAAPSLGQVHCVAVAVAASWTGETIAAFLQRVIAVLGRPVAYLKDGGTDLQKAVRLVGERGLPSLAIDDISHAVATLLKRHYQQHPLWAPFLSACGRVSGKLKQTLLACLAPPAVQTKARFMNVHRLVTWADRLLRLSPAGRAANGSILSQLRACLDQLPACKTLIQRFRADALPLLECQKILKTQGLSHHTLAQCAPLVAAISSAAVRRDFASYLQGQLETATTLGLAEDGLPISSDPIESLFGRAKRHGVGELQDANRIALRLPALCGVPTRAEARQVVEISVAQQNELTGRLTSLTKQRRDVLPHPDQLETLGRAQGHSYVELLPSSKNRSNPQEIINISRGYQEAGGPQRERQDEHCRPAIAVQ